MGKVKKTNQPSKIHSVKTNLKTIKKPQSNGKAKKSPLLKNKTKKIKIKTAPLILNSPKAAATTTTTNTKPIEEDTIRSGIDALFKVIETKRNGKTLFEDDVPIFLHFCAIKIGKVPTRTWRIPLKHTLLKDSSEICLITDDAVGFRKEFEKTIEHYEDFLRERGVTNIKTIMPLYQLKTEYSEYELKRKLVELYDMFLVDAKVSGYVVKKLGKIFMQKRKLPIPIRLSVKNLKENIDFALRKTSTNLHSHGDNFVVQIGHSEMTRDRIYENFEEACARIGREFPGGWGNIRGLNLKTPRGPAIPVYYTLKKASEVPIPTVKAKRPKAFKVVVGKLSTLSDREVEVHPSGEITVKPREKKKKRNAIKSAAINKKKKLKSK